jgi:translation initiation factor IF-1
MSKRDDERIYFEGVVLEAHCGGLFTVQLDNSQKVMARPAGKLQKHLIKIIPGDKVKVELCVYDPGKGRIVLRFR